MRRSLGLWGALGTLGLAAFAACSSSTNDGPLSPPIEPDAGEDPGPGPELDGGPGPGEDVTPPQEAATLTPTGGSCQSDTQCGAPAGFSGACVYGMCAVRASAACSAAGSTAECPAGGKCYTPEGLVGAGICLLTYDAATCTAGAKDRNGLCAPKRGGTCDPATGLVCKPSGPVAKSSGATCSRDTDCKLTEPYCYEDTNPEAPTGWISGYCLGSCTKQADCGAGGDCVPVASDGSKLCMDACGIDLDCRPGYVCSANKKDGKTTCFAGCDDAASCGDGYVCMKGSKSSICVKNDAACSSTNPKGWCPDKGWCNQGACTNQKYTCPAADGKEPNESQAAATKVTGATTLTDLTICDGDEDWFEIPVPADTIVRVGIDFAHPAGDIDLLVYDHKGTLVGSRMDAEEWGYPYHYRDAETGSEYFGLYSKAGTTYFVRAVGYEKAQNRYDLHVDHYPYKDGETCVKAGYSLADCVGKASGGAKLLPFPFPDPNDSYAGNLYRLEHESNYRFARREMITLIRHALAKTVAAFPGTTRLGLLDICQKNGITPGYDVADPRHPESTHDQGGNIDLAYFQTDGDNNGQIICGDGSQHADGYCSDAAATKHIVDLPRQAYFMAQLFAYDRTRVIGADRVIAPLLITEAARLAALPDGDPKKITKAQADAFDTAMAYGDGWPYHHHHIHLSLDWWTSGTGPTFRGQAGKTSAASHPMTPVQNSSRAPLRLRAGRSILH